MTFHKLANGLTKIFIKFTYYVNVSNVCYVAVINR